MRRILAAALVVLAAAALAPRLLAPRASASSAYRVDALFDTAKGLITGQLVKVAGARVGTIIGVTLTPDYKARVQMQVSSQFVPFHANASCAIKPEGLIAENFVQCDPGTPDAPALRAGGDNAPTVPVTHTSAPVTLNDLFDIWNVPTSQRLTLLIDDLGAAGAGRGQDINAILRRANPALAAARRAIAILDAQHAQLAAAVHSTNVVVAQLASRPARVQSVLSNAAAVTAQTGPRHAQLASAIARLPGLLSAARPALAQLDTLTHAATPVVDNLRASAPGLDRLLGDVPPLAHAARPTVRSLGRDLATARPSVATLTALAPQLATFAADALPTSSLLNGLFGSLRDRGFVEGLLNFVYLGASSTARYDGISHFLTGQLSTSSCSQFATTPEAGCSANFTGGTAPAAAHARRAHRRPARNSTPSRGGSAGAGPPATATPHGAAGPAAPARPNGSAVPVPQLPGLPAVSTPAPPPPPSTPATGGSGNGNGTPVSKLLRYLFG